MTYPVNIRPDEYRRWELASGALPIDCDEADLIVTAAVIDPQAWRHKRLTWARFRSLDSAVRVVRWMAQQRATTSAPTPPASRRSFFLRFRRAA